MRRSRRGESAIEFALTLPIFVVLCVAMGDWGWFYHQEIDAVHAVREGARIAASLDPDDWDVASEGEARMQAVLAEAGVEDAVTTVTVDTTTGLITATVTADYGAPVGLVPTPDVLLASLTVESRHLP